MYVTRPLSMYKQYPSALSLPPLEGPNSGYLVVQDSAPEAKCCFGLMNSNKVKELPFPQSRMLRTVYSHGQTHYYKDVILIPVLNQPLSSNRYYVIKPHGEHKGEVYTNTKEDITPGCFCNIVSDSKLQPFDSKNIYQQVEIYRRNLGGFSSKSVAPDGFPPKFLRRKGWIVYTKKPRNKFQLGEASGVEPAVRKRLPVFNLPLSEKFSKPLVVGKWYCPFMFIKEGTPREQVSKSLYYEMTLEQRWEQIFAYDNNNINNNYNNEATDASVFNDVHVKTEVVTVYHNGSSNERGEVDINTADGVMWFKNFSDVGSEEIRVGLSMVIIERMRWEEERFGWVRGCDGEGKVSVRKRLEEFGGGIVKTNGSGWRNFGCYVLLERYVLRRMDGSLVLTYGFRHTNHIRSKWE